jgi:hypothetical protein
VTVDEIRTFFGSIAEACRRLENLHQSHFQYWKKNGVPYGRQLYIEKMTLGQLKARREDAPPPVSRKKANVVKLLEE